MELKVQFFFLKKKLYLYNYFGTGGRFLSFLKQIYLTATVIVTEIFYSKN